MARKKGRGSLDQSTRSALSHLDELILAESSAFLGKMPDEFTLAEFRQGMAAAGRPMTQPGAYSKLKGRVERGLLSVRLVKIGTHHHNAYRKADA